MEGNAMPKNKESIPKKAELLVNSKNNYTSEQEHIHELKVHQVELEMQNEELLSIQEELTRTQKRYFDLYELAPIGYCTVNEDGLIEEANLTLSNMISESRTELIQRPFTNFIFSKDQDIYYFYSKKFFLTNELHECELRMIKEDKTPFWVLLSARAETDTSQEPRIRLVVSDISERKKIQEELKVQDEMMLAQSKQAAMGEMIEMIAHQWKQPLSVISLCVVNLMVPVELEREISKETLKEHCEIVNAQIKQLTETIDDFRNFFKKEQQREQIKIEEVLDSTMTIIGTSLKSKTICLHINDKSTSSLFITKSSLVQVLLNIIGNAKDALVQNKVAQATININVDENDTQIIISIVDNAGGIPESIINQIDEPYFTTKESRLGTGFGLHICRMIMDKHLFGSLTWHNEGEGACFVITLNKQEED